MRGFLDDLRHAARGLVRTPAFFATAVLTLALAIGGNAAIYSALRTLVLRPLPFDDSDRLVYLFHRNPQMGGVLVTPPRAAIDRWRARTETFEAVESYTGSSLVLTGTGEPEQLQVTAIGHTLLPFLGVSPIIGRTLSDADLQASAGDVVIVSHGFWQQRLGGDPNAVGRTLRLSDRPYTIVGVMPRTFRLPMGSDVLWRNARAGTVDESGLNTLAKLRPGVSPAAAQVVLDAMAAAETDPDLKGWTGALLQPADYDGADVGRTLWMLAAAVGMLLLIACVNVANLVLSRNTGRAREVAVRHALGASRLRIVRLFVAEACVLAAAGGVAGLLLAQWLVSAMVTLRPRNLVALERVEIDGAVLAFTAVVAIATGVLFGLVPAFRAARAGVQTALNRGGRAGIAGDHRARQVLMGVQVAAALVLLIGASLLARSFGHLLAVDPGFDPTNVVMLRVSLPASRYGDPDPAVARARRHQFYESLVAAASTVPGVTSAALGNGIPPEIGIMFGNLEIAGRAPRQAERAGQIYGGGYITPAYLATLGIPVIEGRPFTPGDDLRSEPVAIISRSFAAQHFPNASPVGARMRIQAKEPWATIVGVAGDVKANGLVGGPGALQVYFPRAQPRPGFGALVVRTTGDPAAIIPALKAQVWALDPALPASDIVTGDQAMSRARSTARFRTALLGGFSVCGLALAGVGVYGVMALYVGQRRRELGVRLALGATPAALAQLIARQTGVVLAGGLAAGALGAWWLTAQMSTLLYDVAPTDLRSFLMAAGVLIAAAIVATALPARRAMRVDPAGVLRGE